MNLWTNISSLIIPLKKKLVIESHPSQKNKGIQFFTAKPYLFLNVGKRKGILVSKKVYLLFNE